MENETNAVVEEVSETMSAMIDADWDETSTSEDVEIVEEEEEAETAEAEEQEAEETASNDAVEEEAEAEETTEAESAVPETFTLKHLDEVRDVDRDEVISLAQKGMDYDRIRQRADDYEGFLKEMAGTATIEEFIDSVRAAKIASDLGISEDMALERVKLDRERKAFEAEKNAAATKRSEESKRDEDFRAFALAHPDVKAEAIPKAVWDDVKKGSSLTEAYAKYENASMLEELKRLRAENETLKQNETNREKSTGSRRSAGNKSATDDFDSAWYDGT